MSLIENISTHPREFVARAVELASRRSNPITALRYDGRFDGGNGRDIQLEIVLSDVAATTYAVRAILPSGITQRDRCPKAPEEMKPWLEQFIERQRPRRALARPDPTKAPVPTVEIAPPKPSRRTAPGAQMTLF